MKIVRNLAAVALAVAAFTSSTPNASAATPLCPKCLTEGVIQGSGIMPDDVSIVLGFNFVNGGTSPLTASVNFTAFEGTITEGAPFSAGTFRAQGTLTIDGALPGGAAFSGPAELFGYQAIDKPLYGIEISATDADSTLTFYGHVYQTPYVADGLPSLWTSGIYGHPLVGTAAVS